MALQFGFAAVGARTGCEVASKGTCWIVARGSGWSWGSHQSAMSSREVSKGSWKRRDRYGGVTERPNSIGSGVLTEQYAQ
jgi:hypothetical protein